MNDDFKNPKKRDGASKSTVRSVLDGVASKGSSVLSLMSGLLAAALILYSGYVLYDTLYTQSQASSWNYADYKPEIIDDGDVPLTGVDLEDINEDYRAWLTIYETTIDYPVMQAENDLYYASHDIYKEVSMTGSIYLAAGNTRDFSDSYNLIYGHHMDNGAMFGTIDKFAEQDFFDSHREGLLVTESGIYDLYTFAVMKTDAYEDAVYTAGGDRMEEVISYIREPGATGTTLIFDEDALDGAEKVVALSTCIRAETTGRLVVFATMTHKDMMKVTVTGYEGVYDGESHQPSVSVNYPDDTTIEYSIDGGNNWTNKIPDITDVGSVTVIVRASNPVYGTADGTATLKVTPAPVTVTVNESSKVYGAEDPTFSATVDGTINGDTITYTISRPGAGTDENAGNYPDALVAEGSEIQGNYSVTYIPAAFTIEKSPALIVTPEGELVGEGETARYELTVMYDGNAHTLSGIPNYPDGTTVLYSTDGGENWTTEVPSQTDVGTKDILIRATNPNYYDANATGLLRVVPAPVTVTANNASKVYGTDDPVFTAQVSGLIGNDTIEYTISRIGNDETVGTYSGVIVPGGETSQGNYTVSYEAADFTITAADTLVISANGYTGVYDGNTHYVAAAANITDGTTIEYSIDGGITWTGTLPGITNVGTQDVLIRATNPNYDTATASVQLQVTPAPVTVTVNNAVKEYGAQDPVFTAVVSGLLGDDTIAYTISRIGNNEDAGVYNDVIVASGEASQGNYSVVYVPGDLTITPADGLALSAYGYLGVYDGSMHFADASVNLPDGTTIEYSTDGITWTTTSPGIINVGTQTVMVRATNPNYNTVIANVQLQVTPARVTVTAVSATKIYGSSDPVFTAIVSGLLNGDTIEYTVSRSNNDESVGVYERVIVPSGAASQGNYSVIYVPADFTITSSSALVITANGYSGVYDGNTHYVSAAVNLPDGTTIEYSTDGGRTWTRTVPGITDVGTQEVMVRATNPNYETVMTTVQLHVTPAPVTVRVNNAIKKYGEPDPVFTAQVSGLRNGDTIEYTISRAGNNEDIGTYNDVLRAAGDTVQGNYTVVYVPGDFTIAASNELVLSATGYTGVYDGETHFADASVNITDGTTIEYSTDGNTWTTTPPGITDVGTQTVLVRASNPNYTTVTTAIQLQVTPAHVTVTAAGATKRYGSADPVFTATVSGLLNGDTIEYTVSRSNNSEQVGVYERVIVPSGAATQGNYSITYVPADFTITSGSALVISANGYTGVYDGNTHYVSAAVNLPDGTTIEYSIDGGRTWTRTAPGITDVGTQEVMVRATNPNYEPVTTTVQLRVTPAPVTVRVNNAIKRYGAQDPLFTAQVSGLRNGDTIEYTISRTGSDEDIGTYNDVLRATGDTVQGNYTVVYVPGDFTIASSNELALIATGYSGVYDGETHFGDAEVNIPEGTTIEYSTDGGRTWTTTPPGITDAGTITVMVRATNPNYNTVTATVRLIVRRAKVTVTVNNAGKVFGEDDPEFTAEVSGVIDDYEIVYTISRSDDEEEVGVYEDAIVASGNRFQGNYDVAYVPGDFEITAAPEPETEPETEVIEEDETPLSALVTVFQPSGGSHGIRVWALVNLICLILTIYLLIPLLHLAAKFGRKKLMKKLNESKEALRNAAVLDPEQQAERLKIEQTALKNRKDGQAGGPVTEEEFNGAVETLYYRVKKFMRRFWIGIVLEIIVAVAAIVAFILTEDMRLPMVLIDRWTLLMLILLFLNWIIDIRLIRYWSKKQAEEEDEENK